MFFYYDFLISRTAHIHTYFYFVFMIQGNYSSIHTYIHTYIYIYIYIYIIISSTVILAADWSIIYIHVCSYNLRNIRKCECYVNVLQGRCISNSDTKFSFSKCFLEYLCHTSGLLGKEMFNK